MKIVHDKKEITILFDDFSFVFKTYKNMDLYNKFNVMSKYVVERKEYSLCLNGNQTISLENIKMDTNSYKYVLKFDITIVSSFIDSKFTYFIDIDTIGVDIVSKKLLYIHDILIEYEPYMFLNKTGTNFIFTLFK